MLIQRRPVAFRHGSVGERLFEVGEKLVEHDPPLQPDPFLAHMDGVGKEDPSSGYSDYGSLGQYTISGTVGVPQAGLVIAETGGGTEVVEGGAGDSYEVSLTSEPTHAVEITITPDAQLETAPASLTFTPANWHVAQTVSVSAVDDEVAEGVHSGTISHAATSDVEQAV